MKKLMSLSVLCLSFCLYGQNPKKIISIPGSASSFFSWPCNGLQFYANYLESANAIQIWRTDGTAAGTFPVTSFTAGEGSVYTSTENSAVLGNTFYFTFRRVDNYELWKTDGTVSGTSQVNISPLTTTGGLIMANSSHIFITTYSSYEDLYSVDNSGQVTYLSRLKVAGSYNSLNEGHAAIFRDKLVVTQTRFDGQGNPINLQDFFITDGSTSGSYTQAASLTKVPRKMTPCGNEFLLMCLPISQSQNSPTNQLAKLPGIGGDGIGNFEIFYTFSSADEIQDYKYHHSGLWDDGFGLETFNGDASVGNTIFLSGYSDNQGWELWKTDGTAAGTLLVKDIYPGIGSGFDRWNGFVINGKFIFDAYTDIPGRGIFYSDGTLQGTNLFPHIPISNFHAIGDVMYANNKAFFRAFDGSTSVIWQTDGTGDNTLTITPEDLPQGHIYSPFGILGSGNLVYQSIFTQNPGNVKYVTIINPNYKLWNGSVDNNWNNTANWEDNSVPVSTDNILIPGLAPNYPVLNSNVTINSLWINSSNSSFTNNGSLNILGDLSVTASNTLIGTGSINFTGSNNHTLDAKGTISTLVTLSGGDVLLADKCNLQSIDFQSDNKIFLGEYDLSLSQATGITGHNNNRFIVTNGIGRLQLPYIGAGQPSYSAVYPVGSSASSYTPVTINAATGSIASWNVRVINQAFNTYNTAYPETGTSSANTSNAVNKTWFIATDNGNGSGANVTFQWNASEELSGFARSNMKVGRYAFGNWTYSVSGASSGSNPYTFTYNNVPGFSPFTLSSDAVLVTYYADTDGDGYGNPNNSTQSTSQPPGYVPDNTDCNDNNSSIHPNALEVCDGLDNNCNGQIDEGVKQIFYRDADGDGYGNSSQIIEACSIPQGYVSNNGDCNDNNSSVHPGVTEICDGIDNDCNGVVDDGVPLPVISSSNIAVIEGNNGLINAVFTLNLSFAYCSPITVNYTTLDSSAMAGLDYTAASGMITFPANTTSHVVAIPIIGDLIDENNEQIKLQLSNAINATIGFTFITCTIQDNDPEPIGSINDVTVYEDAGQALLTVSLSAPSSKQVRVKYKTNNGTAAQPQDYVRINNGDVTIPSGSTSVVIAVTINNNAAAESTEFFDVQITSLQNATIGDGIGRITILNGNAPLTNANRTNSLEHEGKEAEPSFDVIVFGNPSHTGFILQAKTNSNEKIKIRVFDVVGRVIEVRENLQRSESFRLGISYISGIYFAEITQGTKRKVIKLIKQ